MKKQRLSDAYRFTGFVPDREISNIMSDGGGRIIRLKRRQKKRYVPCAEKAIAATMIARPVMFVIYPAAICEYTLKSRYAASAVDGARA
jgi:hypothetical protein